MGWDGMLIVCCLFFPGSLFQESMDLILEIGTCGPDRAESARYFQGSPQLAESGESATASSLKPKEANFNYSHPLLNAE